MALLRLSKINPPTTWTYTCQNKTIKITRRNVSESAHANYQEKSTPVKSYKTNVCQQVMRILIRKCELCCPQCGAKPNCYNSIRLFNTCCRYKFACAPHHSNRRTKRAVHFQKNQVKDKRFKIVFPLWEKCGRN